MELLEGSSELLDPCLSEITALLPWNRIIAYLPAYLWTKWSLIAKDFQRIVYNLVKLHSRKLFGSEMPLGLYLNYLYPLAEPGMLYRLPHSWRYACDPSGYGIISVGWYLAHDQSEDPAEVPRYRKFHITERSQCYDTLSKKYLGRWKRKKKVVKDDLGETLFRHPEDYQVTSRGYRWMPNSDLILDADLDIIAQLEGGRTVVKMVADMYLDTRGNLQRVGQYVPCMEGVMDFDGCPLSLSGPYYTFFIWYKSAGEPHLTKADSTPTSPFWRRGYHKVMNDVTGLKAYDKSSCMVSLDDGTILRYRWLEENMNASPISAIYQETFCYTKIISEVMTREDSPQISSMATLSPQPLLSIPEKATLCPPPVGKPLISRRTIPEVSYHELEKTYKDTVNPWHIKGLTPLDGEEINVRVLFLDKYDKIKSTIVRNYRLFGDKVAQAPMYNIHYEQMHNFLSGPGCVTLMTLLRLDVNSYIYYEYENKSYGCLIYTSQAGGSYMGKYCIEWMRPPMKLLSLAEFTNPTGEKIEWEIVDVRVPHGLDVTAPKVAYGNRNGDSDLTLSLSKFHRVAYVRPQGSTISDELSYVKFCKLPREVDNVRWYPISLLRDSANGQSITDDVFYGGILLSSPAYLQCLARKFHHVGYFHHQALGYYHAEYYYNDTANLVEQPLEVKKNVMALPGQQWERLAERKCRQLEAGQVALLLKKRRNGHSFINIINGSVIGSYNVVV